MLMSSPRMMICHISLASRSGCHHAFWNVCSSDESLISLVTNAISFNHSCRLDPFLASAKPAMSVNSC